MPIFNNPFSHKAKMGHPKKRTSNNKEEMSYRSNEEDLLTHLGNLQLEVSRLHHELASIQSQHHQARVKEEVSTQRSHQTFSTIGTTQPNLSSGSNARRHSRQLPSPRFHDRHKPDCDYNSRDRPPPVTQIFIPTPSISCQASASYSSNHGEYDDHRSMQDSAVWMDEVRISSLRHYQSTADNDYLGCDYDAIPQYVRTRGIPAELGPKQRYQTGSAQQKHHSASHFAGTNGSNSLDRIRIRTVKRIPTEYPSSTNSSNTRHNLTVKKNFEQPMPLDEQGEYTNGGIIYVPRTVNRVHKYDEGDQALLSNNRRQHRVVWPELERSEEESHVSSSIDKVYQVHGRPDKKNLGEEQQHQQPYQQVRRRSRPPPHAAKCILPALSPSMNNGNHYDNNLLLSQIRKQRNHLKSARDRPEKIPLPKDDVGIIFEAIQNGVTLKHIETPFKNSYHQHKSQQNDMLLQLQERKKAFTQYEGSTIVGHGSRGF